MRSVFYNLARHDDKYLKTLQEVLLDDVTANNSIHTQ